MTQPQYHPPILAGKNGKEHAFRDHLIGVAKQAAAGGDGAAFKRFVW